MSPPFESYQITLITVEKKPLGETISEQDKDKSLTDLDNLPDPDVLALEIIDNLEAGIESFREIMLSLK